MKKEDIPILKSLDETVQNIITRGNVIPDLSESESIFCFSDYAGDRQSDQNNVYSFLFFDYKQSAEFKAKSEALRTKESQWRHHSFIEYKKIPGDKIRARILPEFLQIADTLKGVLIVIYVDKEIDSIFESKGQIELAKILKDEGFGEWKSPIAEKLCQVLLFQSYFASKLVHDKQKYFWYSDRDAINDEGNARIEYVGKLLGRFLDLLETYPNLTGYATNLEKDGPDNYFGDILSIPDLVSGATLEYFEEQFGKDRVKGTTDEILQWFSQPSMSLQKIHIRLRRDGDKLIFSNIEYHLK
jgi:hypothetical protein